MKTIDKAKKKWKNNQIQRKKKKEKQKREYEQAVKIYRSLPKNVKQPRLKKLSWIFTIVSSSIVIIFFLI